MKGWLVFKRFIWGLVLIPFCMAGCMETIDEKTVQDVGMTLTASVYTPTPMFTPNPSEQLIVGALNTYLQIPDDPLSNTIDASYRVVEVSFPPNIGGVPNSFIVTVNCQCAQGGDCCNDEHTFVMTIRAMKANADMFLGVSPVVLIIPETVTEFQLVCFEDGFKQGTMSVPWPIMRDYLAGVINGDQFGWKVRKNKTPEP